jgi:hypothetical protein
MRLPKLQELSLGGTAISTAVIKELAAMPELRRLDLSALPSDANPNLHSALENANVDCLVGLGRLVELRLRGVSIRDESVSVLSRLENLRFLDVRGTEISKAGVDALRKHLPATTIEDDYHRPKSPGFY